MIYSYNIIKNVYGLSTNTELSILDDYIDNGLYSNAICIPDKLNQINSYHYNYKILDEKNIDWDSCLLTGYNLVDWGDKYRDQVIINEGGINKLDKNSSYISYIFDSDNIDLNNSKNTTTGRRWSTTEQLYITNSYELLNVIDYLLYEVNKLRFRLNLVKLDKSQQMIEANKSNKTEESETKESE